MSLVSVPHGWIFILIEVMWEQSGCHHCNSNTLPNQCHFLASPHCRRCRRCKIPQPSESGSLYLSESSRVRRQVPLTKLSLLEDEVGYVFHLTEDVASVAILVFTSVALGQAEFVQ